MKKFKIHKQDLDVDKINEGTNNEMEIRGYCFSRTKTIATCIGIVLTGGLLLMFILYKESFKLRLTHSKCPLRESHKIWLKGHHDEFIEDVHRTYENKGVSFGDIFFYNKKYKYVWQEDTEVFVYLRGLVRLGCNELNNMGAGLTTQNASHLQELHGKNKMEIEISSVWRLLIDETLNPFYLFQLFVIVVWMIEAFYQYCVVLVICSLIAISYSVYEMRKSSIALRDSIHSESIVTVVRNDNEMQISSIDLVPGDVLVIYPDSVMECDAVLISGNCVVNESMLTGESVPVLKVPLGSESGNKYSSPSHKKSTLYCGTKVLLAGKVKNLAVVTETAFSTAKGELVLAILFPKPVDFQFYRSFMKFMAVLILFGIGSMAYTAYIWKKHNAHTGNIVIKVLDVLTFVVPPLLSAGVTFSTGFAQKRLIKKGIRCISAKYICLTGGLDYFCFDKTGTLTEDDLNLFAVLPAHNSRFTTEVKHIRSQTVKPELIHAMASCHALTVIDGRVSGDSVDLELFKSTNWVISDNELEEADCIFKVHPKKQKSRYIQVSQIFPFDSKLQRMSTVTIDEKDQRMFYMKGSPEIVITMCSKNTVPDDFAENLEAYTSRGLRVIAVACKTLSGGADLSEMKDFERENLETNLTFLGLVALENPLKADTAENIKVIQNAGLRTCIVTGDNIRTAIHVARECGILKRKELVIKVEATIKNTIEYKTELQIEYVPIADPSNEILLGEDEDEMVDPVHQLKKIIVMEGEAFRLIRENNLELLQKLLMRSTVFARMLPDQKVQLIEELQKLGYHVGMCGDGANDCGALKAAHSGIALSTEEASIASPFTSQHHSISCVPELIREGRSTLVSIFTVFNYQVSTFCYVALFAVLMLFYDASLFTDIQWVICDVLFIAPPLLFGATAPAKTLYKRRPQRNLLSFVPVFSLLSYSIIVLSSYIFVWYYIQSHSWFEIGYYDPDQRQRRPDVKSSMLFIIMCFSYVFSMVIFCPGEPHRKPFYSNIYLTIALIAENIYVLVLLFAPPPIRDYVELVDPPDVCVKIVILFVSYGQLFVACAWQTLFIEKFLTKKVMPKYYKWKGPKYKFSVLEIELSRKPSWPSPNAQETLEVDQKTKDTNKFYNSI